MSKQNNVEPWAPSPMQREVIDRYAIGYRWYTASRELKVPDRTMADWLLIPEFREMGEQLRTDMLTSQVPMYGAIVERAQRVMLRVKIADGDGDLEPTDPLVGWARDILAATLWPVALIRGAAGIGAGLQPRDALRFLGSGNPKD